MKIKSLVCLIGLLSIFSYVLGKDSYYYYRGDKIPLQLSDDSVRVYTEKGFSVSAKGVLRDVLDSSKVTSVEYMIKGDNNLTRQMSNRFYVQLFDSIADVQKLYRIAEETKTIIKGQVPNMADWYELIVHNSSINNSLEMSNYFYETGLFKDIDPGFCFDFTPSCVSDQNFSYQWGLPMINACNAWTITQGSSDTRIAIIDGNIYIPHNEFTSSQFVDLYNTTTHSSVPDVNYSYHGTMVCGIIAADHNHAKMAGVTPSCKIIPISYTTTEKDSVAARLASGFTWAVQHGADVINCSWGDHNGQFQYLHSAILESAIQDALTIGRGGKGCVVVFCAGNQNSTQLDYPAYVFSDIITVGAVNSSNSRATFSSYGDALDVVAPGVNIYSTTHTGGYDSESGTSFAAPHVSGIAALMLSVNPNLTQKDVSTIIESTAQKVLPNTYTYTTTSAHPNGAWNSEMGYGLVNAYAAVRKAKYEYIIGPKFVCDTAKFYVANVDLQSGAAVSWSINNSMWVTPPYSIIGQTNSDTVTVIHNSTGGIRTSPNNPRLDYSNILSVVIQIGDSTYSAQKTLRLPTGRIPTLSMTDSASLWRSGTSRTFTVSNCTNIPDSALYWTVKKIVLYQHPTIHSDTTVDYYYGRSLTYTATTPKSTLCNLNISVTNLLKECEPRTITKNFIVTRSFFLNAIQEEGMLNVNIESLETSPRSQRRVLGDAECTLELWHTIYGCMKTQTVHATNEQISISGLPQGTYILLLKEKGEITAHTKIQIL